MRTTIALVGPIASGKGTLAEILMKKGYSQFQYGDEVRKEVDRRGLIGTREVLQEVSDSLRFEYGTEIIAKRIVESIDKLRSSGQAEKAIIDGLRHPDEVQWLKENYNTYVIGVTIPPEVRYERLLQRGRLTDPLNKEGFLIAEQRDRGIGQPQHGNQVDATLSLAQYVIENHGTFQDLEDKLNETLITLGIEGIRPHMERK